jgi:hypothetical protein
VGKNIDLTGKTFERLTVIKLDHIDEKSRQKIWECKCSCGNESPVYVSTHTLNSGHTQSCGCLKIERTKEYLTKDLTGMTFGRLTVLKKADEDYVSPGGHHQLRWVCQCNCPDKTIVTVVGGSLRNKVSTSCGCYKRENTRSIKFNDLTGQTFGMLKVKEYKGQDKWGSSLWLCECECGRSKIIIGKHLVSKATRSCGKCLSRDAIRNLKGLRPKVEDLTGQTFGKLEVIKRVDNIVTPGDNRTAYLCRCSNDGNEVVVKAKYLKSGGTKSCGCLTESTIATEVKQFFESKYDAIPECNDKVKNPDSNRWLRFDIFFPDKKAFVEINGLQHSQFIPYYHKTEEGFLEAQKRYELKKEYAQSHGTFIEVDLRKIKTTEAAIKFIEKKISKIKQ